VAQTNSADAPGMPAGAKFTVFKDPVLADDSAGVAFIATVKGGGTTPANATGIWWKPAAGPLRIVAHIGSQPPASPVGSKWKAFTSVALPGGGAGPVFTATVVLGHGVTAASDFGVWCMDPTGTLRALVRESDTVLNRTVSTMSVLAAVKGSPGVSRAFNNGGGIIMHVNYKGGGQGIVKIFVP